MELLTLAPVYLMALALFYIGLVILVVAYFVLKKVSEIWDELGPLLEHEMLMRRIEARLMIEDSGFEIPDWLNDDDEDENSGKIVRLVPKEDDTE